jgi:hypothetical protein
VTKVTLRKKEGRHAVETHPGGYDAMLGGSSRSKTHVSMMLTMSEQVRGDEEAAGAAPCHRHPSVHHETNMRPWAQTAVGSLMLSGGRRCDGHLHLAADQPCCILVVCATITYLSHCFVEKYKASTRKATQTTGSWRCFTNALTRRDDPRIMHLPTHRTCV